MDDPKLRVDRAWPEHLGGGAVDVWVAPLDVAPGVLEALVVTLSPAERARAARYRFSRDSRRFSAARGWLRQVLAAELGTHPAGVALSEAPGKPRLLEGPGLCFNVSHAHELALIAVAEREVGVDVEHVGAGHHGLEAARLACTPLEAAALEKLPPEERGAAFLRQWTAKEAYLKATGQGLAVAPHRVVLGSASAGAPAPAGVMGEPTPARWWVRELQPAPHYLGAVAAEGPDWVVNLRSAAELGLETSAGTGRR